jgi:phospholipid/cholesterol/gamma-HCH transport system permease protein
VLGTSPIRALVVPRVIAVTVIAPVVATIGLIGTDIPMFLLWPAYSGHQVTVSGYFTSMWLIRSPADLIWLWIKCAMTGTLVGVVCCYKGMHAKGGSEGVGRAVNEAVLITILGLYVINDVGNTAFYGHFYNLTILRG